MGYTEIIIGCYIASYEILRIVPVREWVITPVTSELTLLSPFTIRVVIDVLTGMNHQVYSWIMA